jgi:hypothetical protein
MTATDIEKAVFAVRAVSAREQQRGHVAIVADDEALFQWLLAYETRCAEFGVRVIRAFRQLDEAERWLEIVSAARDFA